MHALVRINSDDTLGIDYDLGIDVQCVIHFEKVILQVLIHILYESLKTPKAGTLE